MPAKSKSQQRFFGMCEHDPGASPNCPKGMTKKQMHDFAATSTKGLPNRVRKRVNADQQPNALKRKRAIYG